MKRNKADRFRDTDQTADFSTRPPPTDEPATPPLSNDHQGRRRMRNAAHIEIERIVADDQIREEFDHEELEKLAHSLKTKGQLQPIRVRWDQQRDRYIILMGERRFRAAQLAQLSTIECVVHDEPLSAAEIHELQLIENMLRQNLNPIEEAKAYKKVMAARSCTAKALAAELGLNPTTVQRSVRLLSLPEDIQQHITAGKLPKSILREVQKLKREEEQRHVIQAYFDGGSYADVAGQVRDKKTGKTSTAPQTKKVFTSQGIKIQATSKKRVDNAEIAKTLRLWADELESDGHGHTPATAA